MTDQRRPSRHFVVGVVILLLGLVLLLDQLGFAEANKIFLFWPLILIYFGLHKLLGSNDMVGRFWGGFLTLLGLSFQLEELGFRYVRFGTVWPVFLICVGVLLILRRYESRHAPPSYPPPQPGPEPPGAPDAEPPAAGSTPPPPRADAPGPGAPGSEPAAASQPAQSAAQPQSPPEAQARPQTPPQQPNYPGWDPNDWRHQRAWERFERKMNRMSDRINNPWEPRSSWAPNSGQQSNQNWQSRTNWQPNPNWYDSSEPRLNEVNIFWGTRRRIISKNFMGGEIVAIFGGFDLDLSQADFSGPEIAINAVSIFGGGEIRIPANWEVAVESVGIFGNVHDRTWHPQQQGQQATAAAAVKRLVIKEVSIFGGITIKN